MVCWWLHCRACYTRCHQSFRWCITKPAILERDSTCQLHLKVSPPCNLNSSTRRLPTLSKMAARYQAHTNCKKFCIAVVVQPGRLPKHWQPILLTVLLVPATNQQTHPLLLHLAHRTTSHHWPRRMTRRATNVLLVRLKPAYTHKPTPSSFLKLTRSSGKWNALCATSGTWVLCNTWSALNTRMRRPPQMLLPTQTTTSRCWLRMRLPHQPNALKRFVLPGNTSFTKSSCSCGANGTPAWKDTWRKTARYAHKLLSCGWMLAVSVCTQNGWPQTMLGLTTCWQA